MKLWRLATRGARLGLALATRRSLPFSITCILTHRCNFRCAYCDIPDAAGDEMTTDEWRRALDELAAAGLARASFSGGEALLRRDAIDVIAHARALGLTTSLNSNAWLAGERLDELAPILDMLVLSLDGPAAIHDAVRRRPGSHARVLDVIDRARDRGLAVATITVLSAENLGVVDEVLACARERGFWAYFQPAYRDCFDHGAGLDPALDPRTLAELAAHLDRARAAGLPVGASPGYTERLARAPRFGDCARCAAGRYFGTILPDGLLVPCHLVSMARLWPNGRTHTRGFAGAFADLGGAPDGPGCAISPYQETDLIFGLDARAVRSAATRLFARPAPPAAAR